eukprot:329586-Chlamydomonas_euryale.AAC.1
MIACLPCLDARRAVARVSGDWPIRPSRGSAKPDARRSAAPVSVANAKSFFRSYLHVLVFSRCRFTRGLVALPRQVLEHQFRHSCSHVKQSTRSTAGMLGSSRKTISATMFGISWQILDADMHGSIREGQAVAMQGSSSEEPAAGMHGISMEGPAACMHRISMEGPAAGILGSSSEGPAAGMHG